MTENEPRRVLIVHRYFWPENISEMPLMFRTIADQHLNRGDLVHVVTGTSEDFTSQWRDAFGDRVTFSHFVASNDRGQSALRRIMASVRLLMLAVHAMFSARYHLMYLVSYPPMLAGILILLNRLTCRVGSCVYYVQDLFAYRIRSRFFRSLYRGWTSVTVRSATRTITLSEAMKQTLVSYARSSNDSDLAKRIIVIPNFFSDTLGIARSSPTNKYDIIYAGGHGVAQNLRHFLQVVAAIEVAKRPNVAFFGDGTEKKALIDLSRELGLEPNVTFNAGVSRQQIALEIAKSRFGLVGAIPGLMKHAFPSKLASYGATGTPSIVMCESDSELSQWLSDTEIGAVLDPVSIENASHQLSKLLDTKSAPDEAEKVKLATSREFGKAGYLKKLNRLLDSITDTRRPAEQAHGELL